jgi:Holliday junction resolvase
LTGCAARSKAPSLPRGASRRGHDRERALVGLYRDKGWLAFRAPGSLGVADVIALKAEHPTAMIEVKSTVAGPFHSFGPRDRAALRDAAAVAGAIPLLAWWPPRGALKIIPEADWPE